jgi:hypothetical protein
MDDYQTIINFLFGIVCAGGGWFLRMLWVEVRGLQAADANLVDKVNKIEVLVAGKYVTRDELTAYMNRIFDKLEVMDKKLGSKADK